MTIKLPEGVGFTEIDFKALAWDLSHPTIREAMNIANARLPALFEEWVKREGEKVYGDEGLFNDTVYAWSTQRTKGDTHQAYRVLPEKLKGG